MDRNITDSTYKVYNALGDLIEWLISENQRLNREIILLKQKAASVKFDELLSKESE